MVAEGKRKRICGGTVQDWQDPNDLRRFWTCCQTCRLTNGREHGPICQRFHGVKDPGDKESHLRAGADGEGDDNNVPPPPPPYEGVPVRSRRAERSSERQETQEVDVQESEEGVLDNSEPGFRGILQLVYARDNKGGYLIPEGKELPEGDDDKGSMQRFNDQADFLQKWNVYLKEMVDLLADTVRYDVRTMMTDRAKTTPLGMALSYLTASSTKPS